MSDSEQFMTLKEENIGLGSLLLIAASSTYPPEGVSIVVYSIWY